MNTLVTNVLPYSPARCMFAEFIGRIVGSVRMGIDGLTKCL